MSEFQKPRNYRQRVPVRTFNVDKTMTVQSKDHRDRCDINKIMARYEKTGLLPQRVVKPIYGDVTNALDYHSSLNLVNEANATFNSLPADLRSKFHNNPAEFLDFCSNPENFDEMVNMGLAVAPVVSLDDGVASSPPAEQEGASAPV